MSSGRSAISRRAPRVYCLNTLCVGAALSVSAGALAQTGPGLDLTWNTYDCGGGISSAGTLELFGTIGQPDAGRSALGSLECLGGFIGASGAAPCYANCDSSTTPPVLNVNDFICFLNRFASADPYANCDHSTTAPTLNVNDFNCFLNSFVSGCP